jgi:hypothetical protein
MSASILWVPISDAGRSLNVNGKNQFIEAMQRRFGQSPWEVSEGSLEWLRGAFQATNNEGFSNLASKIEEHGSVRVWTEY